MYINQFVRTIVPWTLKEMHAVALKENACCSTYRDTTVVLTGNLGESHSGNALLDDVWGEAAHLPLEEGTGFLRQRGVYMQEMVIEA